jgi:DNA-binding PucR family transcriptional regulator
LEASVARFRHSIEGQDVYCGMSAVYESTMADAMHYKNAVESMNLLSSRGSFGWLQYDRIGIERLLMNQPKQQILQFAGDILRPVFEYSNKGTNLYSTLVAYIDAGRSVGATARSLNIHPNTLYQRLSKIEDLTGLSLSSAENFMMLSLACHLRKVYVSGA